MRACTCGDGSGSLAAGAPSGCVIGFIFLA
jgi:hypothetical protein